jgi:hypothetical protein
MWGRGRKEKGVSPRETSGTKCAAHRVSINERIFLFYRVTDAAALEFGHILASSCKRAHSPDPQARKCFRLPGRAREKCEFLIYALRKTHGHTDTRGSTHRYGRRYGKPLRAQMASFGSGKPRPYGSVGRCPLQKRPVHA